MTDNKRNNILARTSPRIKRFAASVGTTGAAVDKLATGRHNRTHTDIHTKIGGTNQTRKSRTGNASHTYFNPQVGSTNTVRPNASWKTEKIETPAENMKLWKPVNVATLNVQTLRTLGKMELLELEAERYGISCLGISETRWTGSGHFKTDRGGKVLFAGNESDLIKQSKHGSIHESGVAIWINAQMSKSLLGYNPVSKRIITARFQCKPVNLTMIQVYAPTAEAQVEEKEKFYSELQEVVDATPRSDMLWLCGDFNAKIGNGSSIGKHALGTENDNGSRLTQFCESNKLVARNCTQKTHPRRQYTWRSPDGVHRNQIDYILVQKRWLTSVRKCRTYPGVQVDSDHVLLMGKLHIKLQKNDLGEANTKI